MNFRAREQTRPVTDFTRVIHGEQKYRRLQRIKQRYGPGNLFRENYNVAPWGRGGGLVPGRRVPPYSSGMSAIRAEHAEQVASDSASRLGTK